MDLTQYDAMHANEGAWMTVEDPSSGEPTDARILLAGQDSDGFRKAQKHALAKRMNDRRRGKIDADELEAREVDLLSACTLDWEGIELEGSVVPFSPENVRKIYRRFPFIREQADAFISDRRNFLGNSQTPSASTSAK